MSDDRRFSRPRLAGSCGTLNRSSRIDLEIVVDRDEVNRCLGYKNAAQPRSRIRLRLDELWPRAGDLVAPRGSFRVVAGERVGGIGMPDPTELVGIGVCTIGSELEGESHQCSESGELLDALLLDAYGSAAAEATADALNQKLCEQATSRGLSAARRISPGYGRWDVRNQRELLALLPADSLGISLTEGMMMVPRKSVSFAVRFEQAPRARPEEEHRCGECSLVQCPYRRDEGAGAAK